MTELNEMTIEELKALRDRIEIAIQDFETTRRDKAIAAVSKVVAEHGFTIKDLFGVRKPRSRKK